MYVHETKDHRYNELDGPTLDRTRLYSLQYQNDTFEMHFSIVFVTESQHKCRVGL